MMLVWSTSCSARINAAIIEHTSLVCRSDAWRVLTWVGAVHVDEPGPVEMLQQGHEGLLQLGTQLQDELVVGLNGERRRDEADVQRAAERHQHVDCPPVVQTHDGVHAFRELGADCDGWREKERIVITEVITE